MQLTRANERYTLGQEGVYFLLQDGPIEVVCQITLGALRQLGTTIGLTEPTNIFGTARDAIERAARDKYHRTSRCPYEIVTITTDDLEP